MTANRSANATIKGYFYQFDHTIVRLMTATDATAKIDIEAIEDIDLSTGDETNFIQCKYYEGTEYNHSVIKEAIIAMLRHFHSNGCGASKPHKYSVFGHFKAGQDKLPDSIDIDFLKKKFLTYTSEAKTHEVHVELSVSDSQLDVFLKRLGLNIRGDSYDDQQKKIQNLFISQIAGCNTEDALLFYYPMAINTIQKLAVLRDATDRQITRRNFFSAVNKKEAIFSSWLIRKFGDSHYARAIKRKYFSPGTTRMPKAARFFILDLATAFDLVSVCALLQKLGTTFSHKEHRRTPAEDRFCPYVLLTGITGEQLINVKQGLVNRGVDIADGYAFNGATFSPRLLAAAPTKDHVTKLKFMSAVDQVDSVIDEIHNIPIEVFEFHKSAITAPSILKSAVSRHRILADTISLIMEAI